MCQNIFEFMFSGQAPQQQLILNSVKSGGGQPSLITLSQQQPQQPQQVVLQANNAAVLTSQQPPGASTIQAQTAGQPRQVAIQLQEQPPNLMTQAKVMNSNQVVANQRLRQQRKQSLK